MDWINSALSILATVIISIIGFFLARTFRGVDRLDKELAQLQQDAIKRKDYDPVIEGLRQDIKAIREDYIKKEDFFREINKIDRKLDQIINRMI